jgi:hypothetical protein
MQFTQPNNSLQGNPKLCFMWGDQAGQPGTHGCFNILAVGEIFLHILINPHGGYNRSTVCMLIICKEIIYKYVALTKVQTKNDSKQASVL